MNKTKRQCCLKRKPREVLEVCLLPAEAALSILILAVLFKKWDCIDKKCIQSGFADKRLKNVCREMIHSVGQ